MAKYSAKTIRIDRSSDYISNQFADLTRLQGSLDNLPDEDRAKVGDVSFTADSIVMNTPQVGEIKFQIKERTPQRVAFLAGGLPMPMEIAVDLAAQGIEATDVTASLEIDIPAVLRPMVGGTLQKAVDQFGDLIAKLSK